MLYVPGLARNLILVSKLNDFRMHVTFDKHGCRLVRRNLVVAKGKRFRNLFKLEAIAVCNATYVSEASKNTCMLWHCRLGHTINNVLKTIKKKNCWMVSLILMNTLISVSIVCLVNKIENHFLQEVIEQKRN